MIRAAYTRFLQLTFLSCIITLALSINYISAATPPTWTGPTALPPASNTYPPLNVTNQAQTKDGNLSIGLGTNINAGNGINPLGLTISGSQRIDGWLKVGDGATGNPTQPLELTGTAGTDGIKFPDGTVQTTSGTVAGKTFGGIYYTVYTTTCVNGNPLNANLCSCAAGYTTVVFANVNGEGGREINWCYK